jgi:hypothetical protein
MVLAPSQGPALLLLELKHTTALRVNLEDVQDTSDVDETQASAVRIDTNYERQWFPEQFRFLGDMWKGESSQNTALTANNQHLLNYGHSTDDIFTFFCVVELVHIVNLVNVRFIIHEPTYFSSHFAIAHLS